MKYRFSFDSYADPDEGKPSKLPGVITVEADDFDEAVEAANVRLSRMLYFGEVFEITSVSPHFS